MAKAKTKLKDFKNPGYLDVDMALRRRIEVSKRVVDDSGQITYKKGKSYEIRKDMLKQYNAATLRRFASALTKEANLRVEAFKDMPEIDIPIQKIKNKVETDTKFTMSGLTKRSQFEDYIMEMTLMLNKKTATPWGAEEYAKNNFYEKMRDMGGLPPSAFGNMMGNRELRKKMGELWEEVRKHGIRGTNNYEYYAQTWQTIYNVVQNPMAMSGKDFPEIVDLVRQNLKTKGINTYKEEEARVRMEDIIKNYA